MLHCGRNSSAEELQGDEAVQFYVLGFVDHTDTATTEFLDDVAVRDGLADQVRGFRAMRDHDRGPGYARQ